MEYEKSRDGVLRVAGQPHLKSSASVHGGGIVLRLGDPRHPEGRGVTHLLMVSPLTLDQADQAIAQLTAAARELRNGAAVAAIVDPLEDANQPAAAIAAALDRAGFAEEAKEYHQQARRDQAEAIINTFDDDTPPGTIADALTDSGFEAEAKPYRQQHIKAQLKAEFAAKAKAAGLEDAEFFF
jgi:hypothetical protein